MHRSLVDHDIESLRTELQAAGFSGSHAAPVLRSFYGCGGTLEHLPEQIGPRVANCCMNMILCRQHAC